MPSRRALHCPAIIKPYARATRHSKIERGFQSSMAELDSGVWDDLRNILDERFSKGVPTTEDSVRYCFFHILVCSRKICRPNEVVLEYHPRSAPKTQIDTVILRGNRDPDCTIEFKFHRDPKGDSGRNTQAGDLFGDIFKQAEFKQACRKATCYVVYVTDMVMHGHFDRASDIRKTWYELERGKQLLLAEGDFAGEKKKSIRDRIRTFVPCSVKRIVKLRIGFKHVLVVDEIGTQKDVYLLPSSAKPDA